MSLDDEFERLHKEYAANVEGKSSDEKHSIRNSFQNEIAKYENKVSMLSPENRIYYYYFLAIYNQYNSKNRDEAERYYKLAMEEAHDYNPDDTTSIITQNNELYKVNNIFLRKGKCLNILHALYSNFGLFLSEKNRDEGIDLLKKGIGFSFKDASLKNMISRKQVYSYRSISQYLFQDLVNNEITASNPNKFNDPIDCPFFTIRTRRGKEGKEDPLIRAYGYLKIRCFVKSKEDDKESDEYRNTLMWSHYADSHKGICIRYSFNPAFLYGDEKEGIASRWEEVSYVDNFYAYEGELTGPLPYFFARKKTCWKYEKEVRLLHYDPKCEYPFKALPLGNNGSIEAIYFGLKCSDKDKETIRKILGEKVAYFEMREDEEDFYKLTEYPLKARATEMMKTERARQTESAACPK